MKKALLPILAICLTLVMAVPAAAHTENDPLLVQLWGGQNTPMGFMRIWNTNDTLVVRYQRYGECQITEAHLAVSKNLADIPTTRKGNPKVGKFPFTEPDSYGRFYIPLQSDDWDWEVGDTLYIAAHAVIECPCLGEETAWPLRWWDEDMDCSGGWAEEGIISPFPGANWATYFTYTVQAVPVP